MQSGNKSKTLAFVIYQMGIADLTYMHNITILEEQICKEYVPSSGYAL